MLHESFGDVSQRHLESEDRVGSAKGNAEGPDPVLTDLQMRNISMAIAYGDLAGNVQLGVAIGQWLLYNNTCNNGNGR